MGKNSLRLRPLSSAELKEKILLLQGFGNAWNHFPVDGATSVITIQNLLDEAAGYAILLKKFLEKSKNGGKQIRLIPGSGREFLKNLEVFPESSEDFIRNLLHATFSTKSGYVVKIAPEELNRLIDRLLTAKNRKNSVPKEQLSEIEKSVKSTWDQTNKLMEDIFAIFDQGSYTNPEYAQLLTKMLHNIQSVHQQASTFHQKIVVEMKEEHPDLHEDTQSEGSLTESEKEEDLEASKLTLEDEQHPPSSEIKITKDELEPPKPEPATPAAATPSSSSSTESAPAPAPAVDPTPDPNAMKIRRIASEVGHIQEEIQNTFRDVQVLSVEDLISKPSEGKKFVTDLQHRCVSFSESLMKDLYTLDELTLKQEDRPKRKEQVQRIQSMISDVDNLNKKLHELVESMKTEELKKKEETKNSPQPEQKEKQPEKPKEAEKPQQPVEERQESDLKRYHKAEAEEAQRKAKADTEFELQKQKEEFEARLTDQSIRLEAYWRRMKLKPKMDVDEAVDGYLITSYIPGMRKEDIFISTSQEGRTPLLAVRGHRSPSMEELALMRRQLARNGIQPTDEAILRLGMGRFGTFLEKFAIPHDVDPDGIVGGYEGGELKVILPKIRLPQFTRPAPQPAYFDPREFWF